MKIQISEHKSCLWRSPVSLRVLEVPLIGVVNPYIVKVSVHSSIWFLK